MSATKRRLNVGGCYRFRVRVYVPVVGWLPFSAPSSPIKLKAPEGVEAAVASALAAVELEKQAEIAAAVKMAVAGVQSPSAPAGDKEELATFSF